MSLLQRSLRSRLVAALVLTGVVAVAVTATTLLLPLDQRLRSDELRFLERAALADRASIDALAPSEMRAGSAALDREARELARISGARVAIVDHTGQILADTDPDRPTSFPEALAALARGRPVRQEGTSAGAPEGRVGVPVHRRDGSFALALREPLTRVSSTVRTVRRGALIAAAIAIAIAAALGFALAARLARRVRRLRDHALHLAEHGLGEDFPVDDAPDELGDLSRAFAEMQRRLRRQEDARRAFVATASHELRTPLTALTGTLELLERGLEEGDVAQSTIDARQAREQALRLGRLAGELLELSRLDAGVEPAREPVDLGGLARSISSEFVARASQLEVELEVQAPREPCLARADPGGAAQIVRVLVDNALRFSPPSSTVVLAVSCDEHEAELAVADAGPGVPPAERDLIFERFRRGSETGGAGGFGLGLAIARELAQQMGGGLELAPSERGARFLVRLPRWTG